MNLLYPVIFDMGIDLGGGDVRMTQECLNGTKVRSTLEEMGRKGVSQRVYFCLDPGFRTYFLEPLPDPLPGQAASAHTEKHTFLDPPALIQLWPDSVHVYFQPVIRLIADRNDSLSASLPLNSNQFLLPMDIGELQLR